jgi:hypothetical protein
MSNTPDNIRNMWEKAANISEVNGNGSNPSPSQRAPGPGMGTGLIFPPSAGDLEQLRKPKPKGAAGAAGATGATGRTQTNDREHIGKNK